MSGFGFTKEWRDFVLAPLSVVQWKPSRRQNDVRNWSWSLARIVLERDILNDYFLSDSASCTATIIAITARTQYGILQYCRTGPGLVGKSQLQPELTLALTSSLQKISDTVYK